MAANEVRERRAREDERVDDRRLHLMCRVGVREIVPDDGDVDRESGVEDPADPVAFEILAPPAGSERIQRVLVDAVAAALAGVEDLAARERVAEQVDVPAELLGDATGEAVACRA
jgi:hypothetical protein